MLSTQKHLFDLPEEVTYLNIAAQSPLFKSAAKAGKEGIRQKSLPYLITIDDYFEPVVKLKKLFAQLIDTNNYERIVTVPSVSYGLANVTNNITLNKGDEIILIEGQFPSNVYCWHRLAKKYDAKIIKIKEPLIQENRGATWNEQLLESISDKTAVVALGNIHWSNGVIFELKTIREKTKLHNALLIVDGSQTIGAFPFSIKEIQPDALVCAGYKWLFGPYGSSFAYYGSYFDQGTPIEENWVNRLESENFAGLTDYNEQYKPFAQRYNVGQSGNFIYVKMQIAALEQILQWDLNDIQRYCKEISKDCVHKISEHGFQLDTPDDRTHHLFGVKVPAHIKMNDIKSTLKNNNVYVSYRGDYIRISAHLYNTFEDFDQLRKCLLSV